jgi:hypothetical protein
VRTLGPKPVSLDSKIIFFHLDSLKEKTLDGSPPARTQQMLTFNFYYYEHSDDGSKDPNSEHIARQEGAGSNRRLLLLFLFNIEGDYKYIIP